jgi:hypothetical protein
MTISDVTPFEQPPDCVTDPDCFRRGATRCNDGRYLSAGLRSGQSARIVSAANRSAAGMSSSITHRSGSR